MASVGITSAAAHLSIASGVRVSRSVRNVAARASYKVTLVTPDGEKVKDPKWRRAGRACSLFLVLMLVLAYVRVNAAMAARNESCNAGLVILNE